jgi:hypothetical protein
VLDYSISRANKIVYAPGERKNQVTKHYKNTAGEEISLQASNMINQAKYLNVDKNYQYVIAAGQEHDQKNT